MGIVTDSLMPAREGIIIFVKVVLWLQSSGHSMSFAKSAGPLRNSGPVSLLSCCSLLGIFLSGLDTLTLPVNFLIVIVNTCSFLVLPASDWLENTYSWDNGKSSLQMSCTACFTFSMSHLRICDAPWKSQMISSKPQIVVSQPLAWCFICSN